MFRVMRTHTRSPVARHLLWQVASRPFNTRQEAEDWRDFCTSEYRDEHPQGSHVFFVIETDFDGQLP